MMRRLCQMLILALGLCGGLAQEDREARGRIVDANGRPIDGANVKVRAVTRSTGTRYGSTEDVDASATTGADGKFVIHGQNPFIAVTVSVEATNFARTIFSGVASGAEARDFKLVEGVSIIGTMVKNGTPLPKIPIRISSTTASPIFAIDLSAETDDRGRFHIPNVPPKQDYFLFSPIASLRDRGALNVRRITAGPSGTAADLGEISLDPAFTVGGVIRVNDSPALAQNVRVTLGRSEVNDTIETQTDAQGRFHFSGIPAEIIGLTATIPNHRLSLDNGSLFPLKPDRILGLLLTNKTGLILDFEPGAEQAPLNIDSSALRNEPLLGAEAEEVLPGSIKITGIVTDAETKQPLPEFRVTEGRSNRRNEMDWFYTRERLFTNGAFTIFLPPGATPSAILVSADDHLPFSSKALTENTNLQIALDIGVQARGVLLRPDGKPATNMVVHLASSNQVISILGRPLTADSAEGPRRTRTDEKGAFLFPPRGDESALVVVDEAGFADVPVRQLRTNRTVRLEPWARVEGTLLIGDQPATNQFVVLSSMPAPYAWYPREYPAVSLRVSRLTDSNGHFVFEQAPPGFVQLAHSPQFPGEFRLDRQSQGRRVLLKAGQTSRVDLGGQGRHVFGRVVIPAHEEDVAWNNPGIEMELVQEGGPSNVTLTNLLEKLKETARTSATEAEHERAEKAYQAERKTIALAAREYYATREGVDQLLASRRYLLQFDKTGAFEIVDVPPGQYKVRWLFKRLPQPILRADAVIADGPEQVIEIPPAPAGNARQSFDLGEIKIAPVAPPRRK